MAAVCYATAVAPKLLTDAAKELALALAATEELVVKVLVDAVDDAALEGLALTVITAPEMANPVLVVGDCASLEHLCSCV